MYTVGFFLWVEFTYSGKLQAELRNCNRAEIECFIFGTALYIVDKVQLSSTINDFLMTLIVFTG